MSHRRQRGFLSLLSARLALGATAILFTAAREAPAAQWPDYRGPRIPRIKDGKPNPTVPAAPRVNGKPDLSGLWQAERTPVSEYSSVLGNDFTALQIDTHDITKNVLNVFWGIKPEEEPLSLEGAAAYKRHRENPLQYPHTQCLPAGIPADIFVMTVKMIQAPNEIIMLTEIGSPPRQIYTDGRGLPKDPDPTWMGYSVGGWQGDTLVVETVGLNDRGWLDGFGHPRSESMRITERYRRRDFGHMDLDISFDDPKYYTRPFSIKAELKLLPDSDLFEYVCNENEKDRVHLGK